MSLVTGVRAITSAHGASRPRPPGRHPRPPVRAGQDAFNDRAGACQQRLAEGLVRDAPQRLATFRTEMDIVDGLKRLHTVYHRIADEVLGLAEQGTPSSASRGHPGGA